MRDIFLIDIPDFEPNYSDNTVYSYSGNGKIRLKKLLIKESKGFCSYCYSKIIVDGKDFSHLEHTIERKIASEELTNCTVNMSIACPTCNTSYKKRNSKKGNQVKVICIFFYKI